MSFSSKIFDEGFNKNLTFWYKAGSKKELHGQSFKLIGNDLLINTSDSSLNMGRKTILALEWLDKNCDYDFVVRPTPSSAIRERSPLPWSIEIGYRPARHPPERTQERFHSERVWQNCRNLPDSKSMCPLARTRYRQNKK